MGSLILSIEIFVRAVFVKSALARMAGARGLEFTPPVSEEKRKKEASF
jgi:hypothetical protein